MDQQQGERELALQQVTGRLDMAIAHALTWVGANAPLTEVERQMVDHHVRDMRKVLEALAALAGPSSTNAQIKALEEAL